MSERSAAALPLQGRRILVTRTRDQASSLSERLRGLGAVPIEFPTIRIVPPRDWQPLDKALRRLCLPSEAKDANYSWLIFTSANGVKICLERLQTLGYKPEALHNVHIAAIGPATAGVLQDYGLSADLVPHEYIAEGVAQALREYVQQRGTTLAGQHILLARAAEARKVLVAELQQAGALVDEVAAYTTLPVAHDDEQGREVLHLLRTGKLNILTFTSSSTVRNFVEWLKSCRQGESDASASPLQLLDTSRVACIGPITAGTARDLGLHVDIEATEFTIDGLVDAIIHYEE
ncbi:uroporphyrinogen-III synthase [Ktedonosporobacter rubrisoli]|uniref:uroporphyrinogen-III synthase n=1 Tax=Ktedonosporobacter rubrisoli TaxID=2509675 RepID=UPI0013EEA5C2|nr:uroporphyrinogen-III synthase [Ktedonosporobacter rubrisoli]